MRKTARQLEPKKEPIVITTEMQEEILAYFISNKENQLKLLANIFGISPYKISKILDNHFNREKLQTYESYQFTG